MRASAVKETSFESLNNVENLFVTGDERSSILNQMSRLSQEGGIGGGGETDQSKLTGVTQDCNNKDTSFVEAQLSKINANLNSFTLEQFQELRS